MNTTHTAPGEAQRGSIMPYWVDIPQETSIGLGDDGGYKNVGEFKTRDEAIAFAREHFGADENGRISLVTGSDD